MSQFTSILGSSLVFYAIMWHITLETKSGAMMAIYTISGFLPTFLLSPFAGVWADRYDRKKLIIFGDALTALFTLILAIVFMSGNRSIPLLLVAASVRSIGSAIQAPSVGAILPQIVPKEFLVRVNGINSSMLSAISLGSPIISGALLSLSKIEYIFFIDVITAGIAIAILLFFLKIEKHSGTTDAAKTAYFTQMLDGFKYIKKHRFLISLFIYLGFLYLFVTPAAFLTPLQTTRSFGNEVWRLTAIEIFFSVGMMAGGTLIAAWGGFKNRMNTLLLATAIMALCTLGLALAPQFWLYLSFMGIFGISMPFFHTPSAVIIQEQVDEKYMGRVFSVLSMISTSLMPLGMLIFGPLADIVKIEWILLATGAAMLLQSVWGLFSRRLMEIGH
ncbi:MFS transporter [Treponema sp.]